MAGKAPVHVTVTGAAGQIGYALVFRVASGQLLGPGQPVVLRLLEVEPVMAALEGVVMELDDCAFPLLADVVATADATTAFAGTSRVTTAPAPTIALSPTLTPRRMYAP